MKKFSFSVKCEGNSTPTLDIVYFANEAEISWHRCIYSACRREYKWLRVQNALVYKLNRNPWRERRWKLKWTWKFLPLQRHSSTGTRHTFQLFEALFGWTSLLRKPLSQSESDQKLLQKDTKTSPIKLKHHHPKTANANQRLGRWEKSTLSTHCSQPPISADHFGNCDSSRGTENYVNCQATYLLPLIQT